MVIVNTKLVLMKTCLLLKILILFTSSNLLVYKCKAQVLKGVVYHLQTQRPVANAIIKLGDKISLSNSSGKFSFSTFNNKDTLKVKALGYETLEIVLSKVILQDTIKLFLIQDFLELREVTIKAKRNYLKDSIALRNTYSAVFNFKYQPLKDVIVYRDFTSKIPAMRGQSANYIAVLNVLPLLKMAHSKKESKTKLQETLIVDEQEKYILRKFTKETVAKQTSLSGDSLFVFMNKYKPEAKKLKNMNDYNLFLYIKDSLKEFLIKDIK